MISNDTTANPYCGAAANVAVSSRTTPGNASPFFSPSINCQTATPLSSGLNPSDPDGARFQACAARVTRALQLETSDSLDTEIRVFAMKKADKARTKLIQGCVVSARHLMESARVWEVAARNLPPLKIRQFGLNQGDPPFWADPFMPFPAEVVVCLNTAWERAGTHAEAIPGFGIGDGLGLLLASGPELAMIVVRAIGSLVLNSVSFLLALGQSHHQGHVHLAEKKSRQVAAKQALLIPAF